MKSFRPSLSRPLLPQVRDIRKHPVDHPNASRQRRQFGRRDIDRNASAILAGGVPVACVIRNVSEGGALVVFPGNLAPDGPFRLMVEETRDTLMCEVRHQGPDGCGVRFLNGAEGLRLMNHLYPGDVEVTAAQPPLIDKPQAVPATPPLSNRNLRQHVLDALAERAKAVENAQTGQRGVRPLRQRVGKRLRSVLAALRRDKGGDSEVVAKTLPQGQEPATVVATDPKGDGQPRRSRKKGIKGRSAGGIG